MLHELGACNLAVEVVAGLRATPAVCTRLADLTTLFNMQSVSGDARYRPDPLAAPPRRDRPEPDARRALTMSG